VVQRDAVKRLKGELAERDLKKSDPADKGDIDNVRTDIKKKQDFQLINLNQRLQKLTTEVAILNNDSKETKAAQAEWARRINGMINFCYAICMKADDFMKANKGTQDPYSVPTPRAKPGPSAPLGGGDDPYSNDFKAGGAGK
jgi:hypothetical protein